MWDSEREMDKSSNTDQATLSPKYAYTSVLVKHFGASWPEQCDSVIGWLICEKLLEDLWNPNTMAESSKFQKSWTFEIPILKLAVCLQSVNKFKFKWLIAQRWTENISKKPLKLFSCSTQLSMKFELLMKFKMLKIQTFLAFNLSDVLFIMLINVKKCQQLLAF